MRILKPDMLYVLENMHIKNISSFDIVKLCENLILDEDLFKYEGDYAVDNSYGRYENIPKEVRYYFSEYYFETMILSDNSFYTVEESKHLDKIYFDYYCNFAKNNNNFAKNKLLIMEQTNPELFI